MVGRLRWGRVCDLQVVAAILSKLEDPADVLAVALTCKAALHAAGDSPLRLRATPSLQCHITEFLLAAPSMFQGALEFTIPFTALK